MRAAMIEQRAAERVATSLLGTMVFENGVATCLVRDYSSSGARLQVSRTMLLPDRFDLRLSRSGLQHRVHLRWRSSEEVGVAFEGNRDRLQGCSTRS